MKPFLPHSLLVLLAATALAACQQQPETNPSVPSGAASVASASTPVIAPPGPSAATSAPLPGDHAVTRHYKIAISLPTLPQGEQPLATALRTTADHAKREFLQALPDPAQMPEFADRQFELLLDFKIAANTAMFTSVRETGMQATGGAHPIPVEAAFVFDRAAGRLIALDDLFTDPDAARKALAHYSRGVLLKQLMAQAPDPSEGSPAAISEWKANTRQMVEDGTKPISVNFSVFVVRAGDQESAPSPGLTLIFPPYQVAAYVYGTQTVAVPTSVFAKFLKPGYRSGFAAGPAASNS